MGKQLSLTLFAVVAACGSDANKTPDAAIAIDAKPIDAPKVFLDAPPPSYDFTCFGKTPTGTAADPIKIAGETEAFGGGSTPTPVPNVSLTAMNAAGNTMLGVASSIADGTFTINNIVTGGTPVNGYVIASVDAYRTTYVYPPNLVVANLASVPVPMVSTAQFAQLNQLLNQNDATNGFMIITVSDCTLKPISGATLTAKEGGSNAGTITDLGQVSAQFAGVFAVSNIPDGDVTIAGSYNSMTFPSHVVHAYKKPAGDTAVGTVTVSAVVPGPF